jgi:2-amino-4-hydroxy-6-hydroxymethyldihydropteridine diphosphokinase
MALRPMVQPSPAAPEPTSLPGPRIFVGLGANVGADFEVVVARVRQALRELDSLPGTRRVAASSLYRSAPVDASGPPFVNAVAELRSELGPLDLLDALQALEQRHGRQRPYHHAPRTLDLDLLLHGPQQLCTPRLVLPHPRLHQRAFVLLPLLELAPELLHPALGPLAGFVPGVRDQAITKL